MGKRERERKKAEVEKKKKGGARDQSTATNEKKSCIINLRLPPPQSYLGFDPFLEQVQVRAILEPRRGLDVVVEPVCRSRKRGRKGTRVSRRRRFGTNGLATKRGDTFFQLIGTRAPRSVFS